MIAMAMLTEHQMVPVAGPTGARLDNAAAEIVSRVSGTQSHAGNESSVSSELAAIATMTYSELHLAWRRHYRAVPPKKMSRDILELGIAWNGVTHEVLVVEDGFLWAGKTWASLSAIAREITGTRWSGPRFFGLTPASDKAAGAAGQQVSDHE